MPRLSAASCVGCWMNWRDNGSKNDTQDPCSAAQSSSPVEHPQEAGAKILVYRIQKEVPRAGLVRRFIIGLEFLQNFGKDRIVLAMHDAEGGGKQS